MNYYEATGVLTLEQLKNSLPLKKTFKDKPVAVIECIQSIPCDPCAYVCKFGAVEKKSFGDPPKVDRNKCIGCGECISKCPGLAIFVVDLKYKENEARIMMPYELLPIPKKGEIYLETNSCTYLLMVAVHLMT